MGKINRRFIEGTNWILAGLLSLLGFSGLVSCDTTEEYGTPHADYTIKGKVTDQLNQPITGIKVEVLNERQSALTGKNGEFSTSFSSFSSPFDVAVTDIDGIENGNFENDTIQVEFTKNDFYKKGKGWYNGAAEKEITVKLKEKKE